MLDHALLSIGECLTGKGLVSVAGSSKKEQVIGNVKCVLKLLLPNAFFFVSERLGPLATNVRNPQTVHMTLWRLQRIKHNRRVKLSELL